MKKIIACFCAVVLMCGFTFASPVDILKTSIFPGTASTLEDLLKQHPGVESYDFTESNTDRGVVAVTIGIRKVLQGQVQQAPVVILAFFRVIDRTSNLGEVYVAESAEGQPRMCDQGMLLIDSLKNRQPLYSLCLDEVESIREASYQQDKATANYLKAMLRPVDQQ